MTVLYHQIEPDNYSDYSVTKKPKLPDGVSFIKGVLINEALPAPLIFEVDYPTRDDVPHFLGDTIPIFSGYLVQTLKAAGVDNFQVFPAVLRNPKSNAEWTDFWAFNAIGLIAAANIDESEYDTLMEGDAEGVEVPLLAFDEIVLEKKKTHDQSMFRLAESPSVLLIHDRINRYVDAHDPPDGWGFDATEIEAV